MSLSTGTEAQMSDLIGHLYDAAMDERLWTGIAPRIAAVFQSSSAVLKMSGAAGDVQLLDSTENLVVGERDRSEEHTSELQSLMRISYAAFCLKKKTNQAS